MVKQLFIVNEDAFATEMADVIAGKLGFITTHESGAPKVSGEIAGTNPVQIGAANLTSVEIAPGELGQAVLNPYNAGVKQVVTVNTVDVTEDVFVKLMDVTIGTMAMPMKTFEAETAEKVTALINAEGKRADSDFAGYTAALASGVITITAPIDKAFRVAANKEAVITYKTPPTYTNGTAEKVAKLEQECLTWDGFTNKVLFPVVRPDSKVDKSATYDLLHCDFVLAKGTKDGSRTKSLEKVQLIFAVKKSNLTVTAEAVKTQIEKL